jgi:hypothetical protein
MSICRFIESDAYVYYDIRGGVTCCSCRLLPGSENFRARNEREMIEHLRSHERAGHCIPADAFERLENPDPEDSINLT